MTAPHAPSDSQPDFDDRVLDGQDIDRALAHLDQLIAARVQAYSKLSAERPACDGQFAGKASQLTTAMNQQRSAIAVLKKTRQFLEEYRELAAGRPSKDNLPLH